MQCYEEGSGTQDLEILVQAAFLDLSEPNRGKIVACDAAHLAICTECQETLTFFRGRHWIDLVRNNEPLPCWYAGIGFLTATARRFFFPAYLVQAIHNRDPDLLEAALPGGEQEPWSPLQQELIVFAVSLVRK